MTDWSINDVDFIEFMIISVPIMKNAKSDLDTKSRILASAREVFVKNGYSGASISKIAALAKINHSLIFHHFKNKKNLWTAVKADIVSKATEKKTNLGSIDLPYREFLLESANNMISFFEKNKDIRQILNWQRVDKEEYDAGQTIVSEELGKWLAAFKHYQNLGDISDNVNINFLLLSFLSIIGSISMDPRTIEEVEKNHKQYIDFCVSMIVNASK